MSRLIVVACGAGINTSTIAEDLIAARVEKEGLTDVQVKRVLMANIDGYVSRPDLVMIVSMMKIYRTFDVPVFQGLKFLIGSTEEKNQLLDQIIAELKKPKD
jgi:galactitol-specific phosphotransferase system IIB component